MNINLDTLNQMMSGSFFRLSKTIINSYYYTWVLTPADKVVIQCLWNTAGFKNNGYYSKGIIISNIKETTISKKSGVSVSSVQRSLNKLNYIGAIIKLKKSNKCNKYILGFRISNNNTLYLLYYVILSCENLIEQDIKSQFILINNTRKTPKIKLTKKYCLAKHIRNIVIDAAQNRSIFVDKNKNNEIILDYLFNQFQEKNIEICNLHTSI